MVTIKKLVTYQLNGKSVSQDTPGAVKTESPNWFLFGRDFRGKQVRRATGTDSYAAAEEMVAEFDRGLKRGELTIDNAKKLRYRDIKADYLKDNPEQAGYYGLKHLDSFFGKMPVTAITTDTIREFIEQRREEDEAADPTIRRNLVVLRAMLNLARKSGKILGVPYFPMPNDSEAAGQYITPEQFEIIKSHLPESLHLFFEFMYGTGCRLGALKQVTWSMVQGKDCTLINLPGSITKSGKAILIPVPEEVTKQLRKMFRVSDQPIFDHPNFRPEWAKATAKAGLGTWDTKTRTRTGVRIHDCRCSAAINMLAAGIDESTVLKIGGWATRKMLDRYNVQHGDIVKAAMRKRDTYVKQRMAAEQ
jgi:integrase